MTDTTQFRTAIHALLIELDQSIAPGDAHAFDATRHAFRLRFALARVEEMEHAAVMQSPLYNEGRLSIATQILQFDIDRTRSFLRSTHRASPVAVAVETQESDEVMERAA